MRSIDAIRALPRGAAQVHFVLLSGREGALASAARSAGAQIHVCRLTPMFPLRFWWLLRSLRPDVVHSHVHYSSGPLLLIAATAGVPIRIAQFRSTTDVRPRAPNTIARRVRRRLSRRLIATFATDVVAVSRAVLEAAWGGESTRRPRTAVLYNGVDLSEYPHYIEQAPEPALPTVVQVGLVSELKNQMLSIRVLAALGAQWPDATLELLGRSIDGYSGQAAELAAQCGVASRVVFAGDVDGVPAKVAKCSALIHPSRVEGMSNAVLEAVAVGTPVVASDIPPNREAAALLPGIELVNLSATPAEWAEVIVSHLNNPPTRADRALALDRFRSSPFSVTSHTAALLRLWHGVR